MQEELNIEYKEIYSDEQLLNGLVHGQSCYNNFL